MSHDHFEQDLSRHESAVAANRPQLGQELHGRVSPEGQDQLVRTVTRGPKASASGEVNLAVGDWEWLARQETRGLKIVFSIHNDGSDDIVGEVKMSEVRILRGPYPGLPNQGPYYQFDYFRIDS